MTKYTSKEIKNRLSNIGEAIGSIALEYIVELEKENEQLKQQVKDLESQLKDVIEDNDYYQKENKQLNEKENTVHTLDVLHKEVVRKYGEVNDQLNKVKEIMQKLIDNAPNTYSGTSIELQQKKMFSFQDAVNKAEQLLNSEVEEC